MRWSVAGRTGATAATAGHVAAQLWHPAGSTAVLRVVGLSWAQTVATVSHLSMQATSTRGTPGSSLSQSNNWSGGQAPPSGAILDLGAFTVQPTLVNAQPPFRTVLPAAVGSGFMLPFPGGLSIPAGFGLCVYTPVGTVLQPADVTFFVVED